jgi:hypothetical protein
MAFCIAELNTVFAAVICAGNQQKAFNFLGSGV